LKKICANLRNLWMKVFMVGFYPQIAQIGGRRWFEENLCKSGKSVDEGFHGWVLSADYADGHRLGNGKFF